MTIDRWLTASALLCVAAAGCAKPNDAPKKEAERAEAQWAKVEKLAVKDRPSLADLKKELGPPSSVFSKTAFAVPVYSWYYFRAVSDGGPVNPEPMFKASFDKDERLRYFSRLKPDVQADYRIKATKADSGLFEAGKWKE